MVYCVCCFHDQDAHGRDCLWYLSGPFQSKVLDPGNILVHLMVDDTLFLLIVRVGPDLTVGVGGIKGFIERGWIWGERILSRYVFE